MKKLSYISLLFIISKLILAQTIIRIPTDYSTIQEGLNNCSPGDTVLVAAGTYLENIVWPATTGICLMSESGAEFTILDGSAPADPDTASVILISILQDETTIIDGFTITGGTGTVDQFGDTLGGGIYCYNSSPTIRNNTFKHNTAKFGGAIQFFHYSNPIIENNLIDSNYAASGGGIEFYDNSEPMIIGNTITNNRADPGKGGGISSHNFVSFLIKGNIISHNYASQNGGGIKCTGNSASIIRGNTISNNEATYGSGIDCVNSSVTVIDSNIIVGNIGQGIGISSTASPIINYNDIYGNTTHGIFKSGTDTINAEHNWWGHESGPYHPSSNPTGTGNQVSSYVDFDPYEQLPLIVPVELISFSAKSKRGVIFLSWSTATETNNRGFEIERSIMFEGQSSHWVERGFEKGHGTTSSPKHYTFIDDITNISAGSIAYRLKQIDFDGSFEYSEVVIVTTITPIDYSLKQNFPNPFNPTTTIKYQIPEQTKVVVNLFDVLGNKIETLVNEDNQIGTFVVEFDASKLPSGVYFYRLIAGDFIDTKKMVLLK